MLKCEDCGHVFEDDRAIERRFRNRLGEEESPPEYLCPNCHSSETYRQNGANSAENGTTTAMSMTRPAHPARAKFRKNSLTIYTATLPYMKLNS